MRAILDPTYHSPMLARFLAVERPAGECWDWEGHLDPDGYGRCCARLASGRKMMTTAHRLVYTVLVAPVDPNNTIDHLCRNRACCNPAHLEPVPHAINIRRGRNAQREQTACKYGHEFTPENTYLHDSKRHCRACQRERMRAYRERSAA